MERFKKDKLSIGVYDSLTVQTLKTVCNQYIEQYNLLTHPLSEEGQQLAEKINLHILKINQLKDSNYENRK